MAKRGAGPIGHCVTCSQRGFPHYVRADLTIGPSASGVSIATNDLAYLVFAQAFKASQTGRRDLKGEKTAVESRPLQGISLEPPAVVGVDGLLRRRILARASHA